MLIDKLNQFADGQTLTADGAMTDIIDRTAAADLGRGEPMAMLVTINTDADYTTTDETYTFKLQKDTVEAFSSAEDVVVSAAYTGDVLTAGTKVVLPVPPGAADQQYLRGYVDVAGTTPSVTFDAALVPLSHISGWESYPDGLA